MKLGIGIMKNLQNFYKVYLLISHILTRFHVYYIDITIDY